MKRREPATARAAWAVNVTKDHLVFSAAHFITYSGHLCEALHGHNYRVRIRLEGDLDENFYVFDFTHLKRLMKEVVDELDHRVLLPTMSPRINLRERGDQIEAIYKDRRYEFPLGDVVRLPIPNTTAEMLARYLADRVAALLDDFQSATVSAIELEVEESFGQSAVYRRDRESAARIADEPPVAPVISKGSV